jgi:glycosyltransferase involved in cell wall biosynthesis
VVLIPCLDEVRTIAQVVRRFRRALPAAAVYVFDNGSSDGSGVAAAQAGATVIPEARRGKGHVVQSMFRTVDADVYVMVDGDDTYPAEMVDALLAPVRNGTADMVIGSRLHRAAHSELPLINRLGNRLFRGLVGFMFGVRLTDLLSGYRAFSRRLVRAVPLSGGGFETEAEMTIKALHRGFRVLEVPVDLAPRPPGSRSKIRVVQDGLLILTTILALFRHYRPLAFFGAVGVALFAVALGPGLRAAAGLLQGAAPARLAWALLAAVLFLLGALAITAGLVLHTMARHFQELDRHVQMLVDERAEPERRPRGP